MSRRIGTRSSIVHDGTGAVVLIHAPRPVGGLLTITVWWALWVVFGGSMLVWPEQAPVSLGLALLAWALWLSVSIFFAYALAWSFFGYEQVAIRGADFTHSRVIGPVAFARRTYSLAECSGLRASGLWGIPWGWRHQLMLLGLTGGNIALDCPNKTVRFGIALEEAEARAVVSELVRFRSDT